jgi:hypothetical protein
MVVLFVGIILLKVYTLLYGGAKVVCHCFLLAEGRSEGAAAICNDTRSAIVAKTINTCS